MRGRFRPVRLRVLGPVAACCLLAAAAAWGVGPPTVLFEAPEPDADRAAERMVLLVLEAGPGGIALLSSHVVPGRPKTRPAAAPGPGYLYTVLDESGGPLLMGQFEVDWVLHGDEPDPVTGALRDISVRLERVQFVLKVPVLEGADRLLFHEIGSGAPAGAKAMVGAVGGGDASLRLMGEVDLRAVLEGADAD